MHSGGCEEACLSKIDCDLIRWGDQVDLGPVLNSPACKKVLAAAMGSTPIYHRAGPDTRQAKLHLVAECGREPRGQDKHRAWG
jgi:hypothetical protein